MQLTYRREDLVESYLRKYKELGRPPTVKEINQDPAMASYWSYYRHIGLKDDICQLLNISNIPSTIYHLFVLIVFLIGRVVIRIPLTVQGRRSCILRLNNYSTGKFVGGFVYMQVFFA